jgi:predicted metal-dependent phosphoesterase TrpH
LGLDLHLHTQASDGTLTPEELVAKAAAKGLTGIAVTDHDTTDSLERTAKAAAEHGLVFIPGVEISASYTQHTAFHILGYGIDPENRELQAVLRHNLAAWDKNEEDSLLALEKLGIKIDGERYEYWKNHPERGGWPLLNVMIEMGLVADTGEYFGKYFGLGRPAYVTTEFVSIPAAVAAIKAAGGVPVLAHPGLYRVDDSVKGEKLASQPDFFPELLSFGIEGIEVFANYHTPEETAYFLEACRRHNLLVTGGSDYHGDFAGRTLGEPRLDEAYLPPLLERLAAVKN